MTRLVMTRQPIRFAVEQRFASLVFVVVAICLIYSDRITQGKELPKPKRPNIILFMADGK
ncbi:MAG: hypothetical protein IID46_13035 [Planctomycetes bacterium]|nr:hypothetical protein [Planctomycetota bacterium]